MLKAVQEAPASQDQTLRERRSIASALFLLAAISLLNVIDRKIVGILAEPMAQDLHLNNTQTGILTGFAFSVCYAFSAIPIARATDIGDRPRILGIAVGFWSLMTALCGAATGFVMLVLARMGVALGEAACSPASYSLAGDYFTPKRRAMAMSVMSVATGLGTFLAFSAGGFIAQNLDWRVAFYIVGLPGLLVALLVWFFLPEPRREALGAKQAVRLDPTPFVADLRTLLANRTYVFICLGVCMVQMAEGSLIVWSASLLQRAYGWSVSQAGFGLGLTFGLVGLLVPLGSAYLGDRLMRRHAGGYPLVVAACSLVAAPVLVLGLMSPSAGMAMTMIAIAYGLGIGWVPPVMAAMRHMVPGRQMALATAVVGVAHNLIGAGLGPVITGAVADALTPTYGVSAIRYAFIVPIAGFLVAALTLFYAARLMRIRDMDAVA